MCKKRVAIIDALLADIRTINPNGRAAAPVGGVADWANEAYIANQIATMNAQLDARLRAAIATPKTNQVRQFELFIDGAAVPDGTKANARMLLRMTWALFHVADFINDCVGGKSAVVANRIFNELISTARVSIGTERQPWGAGNHAQYIAAPAYFKNVLETPVNYLNDNFAGMNAATRLNMLTSKNGWDHQKGTGQLADDLFSQNYTVQPRAVKTELRAEIVNYIDPNTFDGFDVAAFPALNTRVQGADGLWEITNITATHFTLTPR